MRHIPQDLIDDARDAIRFGANPDDIAGKLRVDTQYLMRLLQSDRKRIRDARTTSCGA